MLRCAVVCFSLLGEPSAHLHCEPGPMFGSLVPSMMKGTFLDANSAWLQQWDFVVATMG
jgi:hypothetical protein